MDRTIELCDLLKHPGSYALVLANIVAQNISIGKLGTFMFPPGTYIYLGSGQGPGGLQARLNRYLFKPSKLHWHIDWLMEAMKLEYLGISTEDLRLECTWSKVLARQNDAFIPAPGFGSSDCLSGCQAHLVGFPGPVPPWQCRDWFKSSRHPCRIFYP